MTTDAIGGWPLDRPFPALLTPAELRLVFQLSEATYSRRRARGGFQQFEVANIAGVRYSGFRVLAFVRGNPQSHALTFGASRPRRRSSVAQSHVVPNAAPQRTERSL